MSPLPVATQTRSAVRKTILIVEDVEFNRDLLVQLLEEDHELLTAADGQAGIELAKRERPDLILMDLSLPVVDGWEATRRIKADAALREIPIIAVTAHAMRGDAERARAAGCHDYLSKPIDETLLFTKVASFLGAPRATILIVDDEPFSIDVLEQELEGLGYRTLSAANGQEALDRVAATAPDLILLDVRMPVMDGLTVCRILKENEETRLIPIVIMTGLGAVEDRIKGIEAGADDFLTKPVNQRQLVARIQTALRLKQAMDRKVGRLVKVSDHLAKFVAEAVRRLVLANPEAPELAKQERDVSVLFLDISGYTRLSESLPADALNTLVERYFSAFLDGISDASGDITETAGDGFMAIFQAKDAEAHAIRAAECALRLLAITDALNAQLPSSPIAVHMGINSGSALVGSTQFRGRYGSRWTFTASGPVTNLAARLAAAAGPGQIFAGPATAQRLGQRYRLERQGREQLRNMAETVEIYRLCGRGEHGS